jgi:DNA-binding transcriptional regulator PaaX
MGRKQKFKKGELVKKILLALGMTAGIGVVMVVPPLGLTLKAIIEAVEERGSKLSRKQTKETLTKLQRQGVLAIKEKGDEFMMTFTEKGKKMVARYQFDQMAISKPKRWDGRWRVVVFDIPEKKRLARDVLRDKLRDLGFYQLQKSVFIHPFECEREIQLIAKVFEIEPYIFFFRADFSNIPLKVKRKFNLD